MKQNLLKYNTLCLVVASCIGLLFTNIIVAQQQPGYTLYRYNMNIINPAYAGSDGLNVTTSYKSQWLSIEDAPETLSLFYSQPLGEQVGIGLSVLNDKVFIENSTTVNVDFSYKLQFNQTALFFGIKAGGSAYGIDTNRLINAQLSTDIVLNAVDDGFRPNLGVGLYLKDNDFFVSLSSPNLFANERIDNNGNLITQATELPHFYASAGYNYRPNNIIELRPSLLLRYVEDLPMALDISAAIRFNNNVELGAIYKTEQVLGAFFMLKVYDFIHFGYAYNSSLRENLTAFADGSHEFLLRFRFLDR